METETISLADLGRLISMSTWSLRLGVNTAMSPVQILRFAYRTPRSRSPPKKKRSALEASRLRVGRDVEVREPVRPQHVHERASPDSPARSRDVQKPTADDGNFENSIQYIANVLRNLKFIQRLCLIFSLYI